MKEALALWLRWMANMTWQVALVVLVIGGATWLARKRSPRLRYALWSLVILKLCLPPSLSFFTGGVNWLPRKQTNVLVARTPSEPISRPAREPLPATWRRVKTEVSWIDADEGATRGETDEGGRALGTTAGSSRDGSRGYVEVALFAVWAGGLLVLAGVVAVRRGRVTVLLRTARRVESPLMEEMARSLGLRRRVELWACQGGIRSPATFGLAAWRILLPANLLRDLSEATLRPVLLHELCHIRRRDLWVNFLQTMVQVVYWFHPLVWLANVRMRREREMVVDDDVLLQMGGGRQAYGEALRCVARSASPPGHTVMAPVGIVERPSALAARLVRVSDVRHRPTRHISLMSALVVIALGAVTLPQGRPSPEARGGSAKDGIEPLRTESPTARELEPERRGVAGEEAWSGEEDSRGKDRERGVGVREEAADMEQIPEEMEELGRDISELRREMAEVRRLLRELLEK